MLIAGLTTKSNDQLLESGGMICIKVSSKVNNDSCILSPGKNISIAMPNSLTTNVDGIYYIESGLPTGTYSVCLAGSNSILHTSPTSGVVCSNGSFGASVSIVDIGIINSFGCVLSYV